MSVRLRPVVAEIDELVSRKEASSERERERLAALIERLRARDAFLVETVLRELLPRVRGWTVRLLGPHPDLEDALQDALSEVASALHRYEGRGSLTGLAHRITLRSAYRYFRRKGPWKKELLDVDTREDGAASPEDDAVSRELVARLYEHLERLTAPRRTAFVLCAFEGMQPHEAAQLEGCSAVAMRGRYFHAREELARSLREDLELSAWLAERGSGRDQSPLPRDGQRPIAPPPGRSLRSRGIA
jgi:RNA polymerase sigma factor (sigma-70 family)